MFTKNELSITLFAGIFLASMLLVSFTNTPVYASHYCDHQWVEAGAIFYTNNLQFNKQSYSTSDSPNVSGKVNDCNIDEVKIVITDSCEKIVATATSSVPRNQGDYQDSFWVQVQASDWYYSGTYRADASANGNKISSTTMSFNGPGPQISSSSDPNCSKPKPLASDVKAPTVSLPSVGAGWVSLSGNSKVGNTSYSSSGSFGYEISSGNIKNGKGSANVKVSGPVSNNYGQNCSISGTFYTTFSVKGQISNGKLIFTPYNISPSSLPAKLTCSNTTFLDGDSYNVLNPLSFSESLSLSHSQGASQTKTMSFSSGSSTWKAVIEKIHNSGSSVSPGSSSSGSSTPSSSYSSGTKSSESGTFRYAIDHPKDSTYEAGTTYIGGKIVTPFSSHKHSVNIWYTVSGNAAHWISPQKLDFGMMTPGKQVKLEYEIQVPSDTIPGNYEYTWTMGCNSLFENVICNSKDTVNVTVEPGRWSPPTDSTSEHKSSIDVTKDPRCPEGSVYYKTGNGDEVCAIIPSKETTNIIDYDRDGIPDEIDQCPKQKENENLYEDKDGCPDVPPIRSYNIAPGERFINPESVEISGLNWIFAKGSDTLSAVLEYYSPDDVEMKCPQGCTYAQMEQLNKIALKAFGSKFEPTMSDIFDGTALASDFAKKGLITTMWEQSKFFHRDLPQHMSETEAQTWHVILTGHMAILDQKTEYLVETDQLGTKIIVFEDYVDIFYKDPSQPIRINTNEYAFASENKFEKGIFDKTTLDRWWEQPSREIGNIFEKTNFKSTCPKPFISDYAGGYFVKWIEDIDGKKNVKGIKIGYQGNDVFKDDFDGKMSNLQIDCTAKTLSVDLEGSGSKDIVGELYVMEDSKKIEHKAKMIIKSLSISSDGRDINYVQQFSPYNAEPAFGFLVMPGTKTVTISNLSLIPESLQEIKSAADSTKIKGKIPEWIKNNVKWWADGTIDDSSFKQGIQHMIKENIISIKDLPKSSGTYEDKIPEWIKQNARWWADGTIGEEDFVNGLKYMVKKRIIGVN